MLRLVLASFRNVRCKAPRQITCSETRLQTTRRQPIPPLTTDVVPNKRAPRVTALRVELPAKYNGLDDHAEDLA